ncbi:hypothetical protein LC612_30630 [Nostoc sp. CHAB 5834]|nr:hypothetical protein [Nostoc sp. CHAB 5834]
MTEITQINQDNDRRLAVATLLGKLKGFLAEPSEGADSAHCVEPQDLQQMKNLLGEIASFKWGGPPDDPVVSSTVWDPAVAFLPWCSPLPAPKRAESLAEKEDRLIQTIHLATVAQSRYLEVVTNAVLDLEAVRKKRNAVSSARTYYLAEHMESADGPVLKASLHLSPLDALEFKGAAPLKLKGYRQVIAEPRVFDDPEDNYGTYHASVVREVGRLHPLSSLMAELNLRFNAKEAAANEFAKQDD